MSFSADWSRVRNYWRDLFWELGMTGKPGLRFLEVGCFEGRATLWLLEYVLSDWSSVIEVVDTFRGSPEFDRLGLSGDSRARFDANTAAYADRVTVHQGESSDVLPTLPAESFDFVYVDGSHLAADVQADGDLAWPLLKPGGSLCFDDYTWDPGHILAEDLPKAGIDAFLYEHLDELRVRMIWNQVVVDKR